MVESMSKKIALFLIRGYQKTVSPDHGPLKPLFPYGYCRFQPTCSMYTYEAIDKYGVIKGSALGFWRIMRCNPWNKGGHDPVK
jgi:putative membrane protein insertion efficiency factor